MRFEKVMRVVSAIYAVMLLPLNMTVFSVIRDLMTGAWGVDVAWARFVVVTAGFGIVLGFLAMTDDEILLEMRLHLWCLTPGLGILVADGLSSFMLAHAPAWLLDAIVPIPYP